MVQLRDGTILDITSGPTGGIRFYYSRDISGTNAFVGPFDATAFNAAANPWESTWISDSSACWLPNGELFLLYDGLQYGQSWKIGAAIVTLSSQITPLLGDGSGLTNLSASAILADGQPGITTNVTISGVTFCITNGLILRVH